MKEESLNPGLEKKRLQILAVRVSIAGSVALFLVSAAVGIAVDSVTLILDASANLVIIAVAFLMNYAINKIHRPADEAYHFGYHKYEPLVACVQGVLIFSTCAIAIKFAVQDILHAEDMTNHLIPVVATFFSSILGVFITIYLKKTARRTGSSMLEAAGTHWHMDTALSFGICFGFFLGLILQKGGYARLTPYVDPVMAIILALVFLAAPAKTIFSNLPELLDAAPGGGIYHKIRKVLDARKPASLAVGRVRTRKAGEKIFLEVIFTSAGDLTIAQTEELADRIEQDMKSELGNCDVVTCFKSKTPFSKPSA
ncbi:MAG: cation diffusion facilitator family transporter [Candidatus Omnitrophota bacterium]